MWTCPKCGTKVDPSFDVCWKCGTNQEGVEDPTFVGADESGPIPDAEPSPEVKSRWAEVVGEDHSHDLVVCYQALSLMEATFLANQLNDQGIPAVSDTQDMQDALGTWDGNPRVYCRAEDLEKARAFLTDYEARKQADMGGHMER